eukprot:3881194-Pyramimonas_sp.AAC.1
MRVGSWALVSRGERAGRGASATATSAMPMSRARSQIPCNCAPKDVMIVGEIQVQPGDAFTPVSWSILACGVKRNGRHRARQMMCVLDAVSDVTPIDVGYAGTVLRLRRYERIPTPAGLPHVFEHFSASATCGRLVTASQDELTADILRCLDTGDKFEVWPSSARVRFLSFVEEAGCTFTVTGLAPTAQAPARARRARADDDAGARPADDILDTLDPPAFAALADRRDADGGAGFEGADCDPIA